MDAVEERTINRPNQLDNNGTVLKRSTGYSQQKEGAGKAEQRVKLKRQVNVN